MYKKEKKIMANTQLTQTGAQVQADLNRIEALPTPTSADNGKYLGVDSSGNFALISGTPSGYTVTITTGSNNSYTLSIYDGQNNSAPLLTTLTGRNTSITVNCTSGYLAITNSGGSWYNSYMNTSGGVTYLTSYPSYRVTGDGAIIGIQAYCFVKGTKITLADNTTKNVEDITYDDELLVWNFYEGKLDKAKPVWIMEPGKINYYWRTELSDGTILKLAGPEDRCHRLFNVDKQQMIFANKCVGDRVYKQDDTIVTVVSCEQVEEEVEFYNITTEKYINCFADGVLAGSRLNNIYHISDMKYDSDERLISEEEENERWAVRGMEKPEW